MSKEITIGVAIATMIFLALQGVNLLPFLLLGALSYLFYNLSGLKVLNKGFQGQVSPRAREITFADIGGQEKAKQEIIEALEFIKDSSAAEQLGIRPLKGILLAGPPGTGKTLLAKAAAAYTGASFIAAAGSEFVEMYAGVGAQRIRALFKQARELAKQHNRKNATIFIDEIDVLGGKRGQHSGHLEYDQTLNQLLVEMDGISPNDDVRILVIGATNRVDLLDEALLRPGRFDRIIQVELPDREGRLQILKIHTANKPLDPEVNLESIASQTFGFSGAHLESLANEAAILAFRAGEKTLKPGHFNEAIDKVMLGEKMDRQPSEKELKRVAVHEIGHALVSERIRPGSVSIVTIVPRGSALGYMREVPEDDSYLQTRRQLEERLQLLIAGAIAEELLFHSRSTGASSDFIEAARLAKKMVFAGMSDLGIVDPESLPRHLLHRAVARILQTQEALVRKELQDKVEIIRRVSKELLQEEKLAGERLRQLIAGEDKPLERVHLA
ncbi:MAG TPA: AAA family ATPase [Firmicutes bacterium]|nr:AAA family ATPase [Bacillota bacterium]